MFAYRHIDYSHELWWQVALHDDAPRFLRVCLGAAERIVRAQDATLPYLAWLRDKELLFNPERTAFIMYGVQGRTWVALGDPVGPPVGAAPLIRDFADRAND